MPRHSFIQMSKLPNVKGRISYITSHARQENLYATYRTADSTFWSNLARESQQEFQRSGTEGKCIEARELIIALPEVYTQYEPQQVLTDFTEEFRRRYGVECVSALHHNKRKTNYHIHLIFSERKLLPEPDVKIASRSVFFDETGKRVRTKKEITGEDGQIRKGCTVIKKGEVYESHLFTAKDTRFKGEPFLREIKEVYTELINRHISDPEQHLKVFDKNSVYLPAKKIGKNNPKEDEIKADNAARQEWNRTADMALLSGISEAKILEVKQTEIHEKASQSIKSKGWLPGLFRSIVSKAKDFLQNLIREHDMPPKPVLEIDMAEFRTMQKLMIKAQDKAKEIRHLQDTVLLKLKQQLADTKGIFKGKERKALTEQIQRTEKEIAEKLDKLPDVLKEDGYPDVQAFMATYRKAEAVVEQYNRDLAAWEREVRENRRPAEKERLTPPEKKSIRDQLRRLQAEGRQRSQPKRKSHDRER
uniref:MobA/MobL family protein n=1 Tax=Ruminococcus bromii TaxID=40518 RepID=UPI0040284F5D